MTQISDRTALVTGASSGIGRATALALAAAGARVALAARREEALRAVADEIERRGGTALVLATDVTDPEQVSGSIKKVLAEWGRIDLLVANAGSYVRAPVADLTLAHLAEAMDVNFYGSVYPFLAVLPHMLERGTGHIVLVTSVDGRKGLPPDAPYVAAKFALTGFGDVARQELRSRGVEVTTVLPARVQTPMIEGMRFHPISRPIGADRVAKAIVTAIERDRAEVVVPATARALIYAHQISPRLADWAVRFFKLEGWETEPGR